ncbi:hypothetical protein CHS0354_023141 [Potamilus streckersoni]|uniref:Uncharacterized protein n=1 Tax=Potamilus streckersoni TaxID=2493646 RepID=A0AAE0RN63_9BIVA|nr:hypothetical protein CHS0354_023141 [Potamilus streckersoni]
MEHEKDSALNEPSTSKLGRNIDAKKLEFALRLQKIEEMKQKIQESVVITQKIITDIDNGIGVTVENVENLKGIINGWMIAEKDKNKEDHSKRTDNRQKGENGKKQRSEEDERRRRINEELKEKEEEMRRLRENNERKLKDEKERRLQEETERRMREEEERNNKLEEERIQRSKEEQLRTEEDRKRKEEEEEEKRLKEDEERRHREAEGKRRMQDEEDRKHQAMEKQKRDEEERLMKLEEERKRIEEEKLKRDPANWKPITYKRYEEETNSFHGGVCCQVAAMDGTLDEEDLECLASDEWREEKHGSMLSVDEKIASSIINIDAKTGEKIFPVPMRVYVPHCSISDSSDEIVVKMSIDGGEWTEQRPASVPQAHLGHVGLNYAGIDVSKFKTVKVVAVAKTRSQEFFVDNGGTSQISTVDKNIKLFIPRDTFSKSCKLKLQVRQMRDHSLMFATRYYKHCHNVLSTSSVMKIASENATNKNIELDLARNTRKEKKTREKGKYLHLYKCRGDSWKIADSEFKGKNMDVSVTLPSRKETYVVMEIEGRPTIPTDEFLNAADELYFHSNASIVRIIAKQRADNPHIMMIQCVGRDLVESRVSEMKILGYTHGPDTSKEFSLLDGQCITLECSGNIKIATGAKVNLIFHSYVETAKQEVHLQVVDEYKQKELDVYLGNLHFQVMRDTRDVAFHNSHNGSIPLTLPKVARENTRKARIQIRFPHYLTALAKFLAIRLTMQPKEDDWLQIIYRYHLFNISFPVFIYKQNNEMRND